MIHPSPIMKNLPTVTTIVLVFAFAMISVSSAGAQTIVPSFAGNAQHTAVYNPAAHHLNAVHWTTSIDLNNTGAFAHYGAPLQTGGTLSEQYAISP